jgi:hypothetical protein
VQSSFKNPHQHIGKHTFDRIKEKRSDFRQFISNIGVGQELELTEMLTIYLRKTIANLNFMDEVYCTSIMLHRFVYGMHRKLMKFKKNEKTRRM